MINWVIDKEFDSIIPPLTAGEYQQLEKNVLGFSGWNKTHTKFIEIMPSETNGEYWFVQISEVALRFQTYTKRPIKHDLIKTVMESLAENETFSLVPQKTVPWPIDVFTKETELSNEQKGLKLTNLYFIQSVTGGPVKIGVARNPEERLKQHQTGSPFPLRIIKTIKRVSPKYESELHKRFSSFRLHGEWFSETILDLFDGEINETN